jgi:hypothetical protein
VLRLLRVLHPLEWVVLGFMAYVFARGGTKGLDDWEQLGSPRTTRVFVALAIVGTLHLWRKFRKVPWTLTPPQRVVARSTLGVALLPLMLAAWQLLFTAKFWNHAASIEARSQLPLVAQTLLQVLGFGTPTMAVWLALALHHKEHGQVKWPHFARQSSVSLLKAFREWAPVCFLISTYAWMGSVIGQPTFNFDAVMAAADRALFFGHDPIEALQAVIWAPLSTVLAFSYAFYVVLYPLVMGAVYSEGGVRALREGATALGLGLAISFISYTLVPVKGPILSRTFDVPLDAYFFKEVKEAMVDATRITYDCFPSFHTAGTLIFMWAAWRHVRPLFWWLLPITIWIPFACLYLRYHYVMDLLAAVAMFLGLAWGVPRLLRWWFPPLDKLGVNG